MADVALDLGDIFSFFLDDVSICTYCRRVIAATSSSSLVPRFSMIFLVFFTSLVLVRGRLLVLAFKYVSRRNISEFCLFKVFLLCFG